MCMVRTVHIVEIWDLYQSSGQWPLLYCTSLAVPLEPLNQSCNIERMRAGRFWPMLLAHDVVRIVEVAK